MQRIDRFAPYRVLFIPYAARYPFAQQLDNAENLSMKGIKLGMLVLVSIFASGQLAAQDTWHIHPQWSSDGQTIAYYNRVGSTSHIVLVHLEEERTQVLTTGAGYDANPTWSPDGQTLALTRSPAGTREWDLYTMALTDREPHRIAVSPEREMHPSWSPTGEYIAFIRMDEDGTDVYLIRSDGTGLRQLTTTPEREFHPKWSPDGRFLAFDGGPQDKRDIYALEVETGALTQVTDLPGGQRAAAPAWSPDGQRIVFSRHSGESQELYIIDRDGSGIRQLTDTPDSDEGGPFWSPDGEHIAFHANRALHVMRADGTGRRQIAP